MDNRSKSPEPEKKLVHKVSSIFSSIGNAQKFLFKDEGYQAPSKSSHAPTKKSHPPKDFRWEISDDQIRESLVSFSKLDGDGDGSLNAFEAKEHFQQSGLSDTELAHIWNVACICESFNITKNEFCVLEYLISVKKKGIDIPKKLPESLNKNHARDSLDPEQMFSRNRESRRLEPFFTLDIPCVLDMRASYLEEVLLLKKNKTSKTNESRERKDALHEIIDSEFTYTNELDAAIELYLTPIEQSDALDSQDVILIFSNFRELLNANKTMLSQLEEVKNVPLEKQDVGSIFMNFADSIQSYVRYCSNYPQAITRLNELKKTNQNLVEVLAKGRDHIRAKQLGLDSYLIKPVQSKFRFCILNTTGICKYPLLLKEILKHTPENTILYSNLKQALSKIEPVVESLLEKKEVADNLHILVIIQETMEGFEQQSLSLVHHTRKFVRDGETFKKSKRWSEKVLHYFMFNDLIVYCKSQKFNPFKKHTYLFKGYTPFDKAEVKDIPDNKAFKNVIEVSISSKNKTLLLCFTDFEEKKEMIKAVKDYKRSQTGSALGSGGSKFLEKAKSPVETFALPTKHSNPIPAPVKQSNPSKSIQERPLSPSPTNKSSRVELVLSSKKREVQKESLNDSSRPTSPPPETSMSPTPIERGRASSRNRENRGLAKSFVFAEDFSNFTKTVVDKMRIFIPIIQYKDPLSLRVLKCFSEKEGIQFLVKEIKVSKEEAIEFLHTITEGGYAKIVETKPENLYAWK